MSLVHVSTAESFMWDEPARTGYCPVCCRDGVPIRSGWLDTHCGACDNYSPHKGANRIVYLRRRLLGLSRKEMAAQLGLSHRTVANYENVWPSRRYWEATKRLMTEHHASQ